MIARYSMFFSNGFVLTEVTKQIADNSYLGIDNDVWP